MKSLCYSPNRTLKLIFTIKYKVDYNLYEVKHRVALKSAATCLREFYWKISRTKSQLVENVRSEPRGIENGKIKIKWNSLKIRKARSRGNNADGSIKLKNP